MVLFFSLTIFFFFYFLCNSDTSPLKVKYAHGPWECIKSCCCQEKWNALRKTSWKTSTRKRKIKKKKKNWKRRWSKNDNECTVFCFQIFCCQLQQNINNEGIFFSTFLLKNIKSKKFVCEISEKRNNFLKNFYYYRQRVDILFDIGTLTL